MSDSDFDEFDSFPVDDSFFQQLDDIEVRAAARPTPPAPTNPASSSASASAASASASAPTSRRLNPPPSFRPNANAQAGPSRRAAALGVRLPRPPPHPSSDDYGDMSFTAESLEQIESLEQVEQVTRPRGRATILPSSGIARQFARTASGPLLQTHLNFRRENPYTKGKRWDRTQFAATGRRIVPKDPQGKGKGKGREEDIEYDEDEEDWGEPLAPDPAPPVDTSKPYEPQKHKYIDANIGTYLYPTNHPKRSYQYDIIRSCFTDNTLVALPTGLGKTFVAGVVMLNFYRWFPTGKIVFLAPTRPLVNQQIEACQLTCGIPSKDAAVMTGQSISAKKREQMWDERRVFYCTPQTLDNDLKRGAVDPRDIVLAVFDEAHKASGSYAYTTILALITASNPYFRVLALTATPGNDVPKVQGVVDALHISRIEIREAESPEVRQYMNEKRTEKHVIPMGPTIGEIRDRWATLMKPFVQRMVDRGVLTERDLDVKRLKTFRITARRQEIFRDRSSGLGFAIGTLNNIEKMCRAMANLLEFSIGMFHTSIMEISGGQTSAGKAGNSKSGAMSLRNNVEFQRLVMDVEGEINDIRNHRNGKTRSDAHPKMQKTLELLLAHFSQAEEDSKVHGVPNTTRAMVFCSFRECVLEIVDMLNDHRGLLKATKFVGQSQGKQEKDKGFTQKDQKKAIADFKEGKFNILVATSIGEEGLDIGEVDFVVIYDMPKQSIKLLQRIGRTGRKRDGHVHVLMSEGREDLNWETAQQTHRDIQEEILHSRNLELFEDVERLLPSKFPECIEKEMEIDPWDPAEKGRQLPSASQLPAGTKGKTKAKAPAKKKRVSEVPAGHEGFKSVAQLLKEQSASKKKRRRDSDVSSEEEERVRDEPMPYDGDEDDLLHGSVRTSRVGPKPKKTTARSRSAKKAKPSKDSPKPQSPSPRQLTRAEQRAAEQEEFQRQREDLNRRALDFFNTQGPCPPTQSSPPTKSPVNLTPPSSPHAFSATPAIDDGSSQKKENGRLSPRTARLVGFSQIDLSMDLSSDEEVEVVDPVPSLPPSRPPKRLLSDMPPPPLPSSPSYRSVVHETPLPRSAQAPSTSGTEPTPFPVRRVGQRGQPLFLPSSDNDTSEASPALRRLRRRPPSSPPETSPIVQRRQRRAPNGNRNRERERGRERAAQFLDVDAGVSGSESPDEGSGEEDDSDRLFAGDFQATQAPRGYDQHAMYAAGLNTQVAGRAGLNFRSRDRAPAFLAKARRPVMLSDEERSDNEYELGSFVCDDDDELFDSQRSDPLGSGL